MPPESVKMKVSAVGKGMPKYEYPSYVYEAQEKVEKPEHKEESQKSDDDQESSSSSEDEGLDFFSNQDYMRRQAKL